MVSIITQLCSGHIYGLAVESVFNNVDEYSDLPPLETTEGVVYGGEVSDIEPDSGEKENQSLTDLSKNLIEEKKQQERKQQEKELLRKIESIIDRLSNCLGEPASLLREFKSVIITNKEIISTEIKNKLICLDKNNIFAKILKDPKQYSNFEWFITYMNCIVFLELKILGKNKIDIDAFNNLFPSLLSIIKQMKIDSQQSIDEENKKKIKMNIFYIGFCLIAGGYCFFISEDFKGEIEQMQARNDQGKKVDAFDDIPGWSSVFFNDMFFNYWIRNVDPKDLVEGTISDLDLDSIDVKKESCPEDYFEKGKHYLTSVLKTKEARALDLAIVCFNKAIEINPSYSKAYYNRGVAYYNRGVAYSKKLDYVSAVENIKSAFDTDKPQEQKTCLSYLSQEAFDKTLLKIENRKDQEAIFYRYLANIYMIVGKNEKAIELRNRAKEIEKKDLKKELDLYNDSANELSLQLPIAISKISMDDEILLGFLKKMIENEKGGISLNLSIEYSNLRKIISII